MRRVKQYFEPTLTENPFYLEEVLDWEKRIAGYTTDIKGKYKEAFTKMDEFLKVLNDDPSEYKVVINDKKKGLLCE